MRIRGLLVAAAALAALGGLLYWSNRAQKAKEGKPDPNAPPKILELKEDNLVRFEIRKRDQAAVVLEKGQDGSWKITAPETLNADPDSVRSLVSTVTSLNSDRVIEENPQDLAPYGLQAPAIELVIGQKEGGEKKLLLGDETPTGSYYFVKLDGDARVFTMASWNKTSIDKGVWDLRDKRLLTFDSDKLTRLELTAKNQTIEIGKNAQNEWQILKPRPLRADGGNVEQLISRLRDAKMDSNLATEERKKAEAAFAKASLVAVARVTDAAGTQQLEVRKTKENDYYARSSVVDGVHKITSWVGEGLDKGLDDLRNKKLFDFGWNEPTKVELRDGTETAVYEKSGDKWMRAGKQMDSTSVRNLIDKLRDLAAHGFPETGFTEPVIEARVTWDGGKRTEKVLISKSGEKYFARREGEPAIYELTAADIDGLRSAAKDVKEQAEKPDEKKKS